MSMTLFTLRNNIDEQTLNRKREEILLLNNDECSDNDDDDVLWEKSHGDPCFYGGRPKLKRHIIKYALNFEKLTQVKTV